MKREQQHALLNIINQTKAGKSLIESNTSASLEDLMTKINEQIADENSDLYTSLKSRKHLDLRTLKISYLPSEIKYLTNLKTLNLFGAELRLLPEEIKYLTKLEELDIFASPITYLPSEIKYLKNLKSLNIAGTKITHLPNELQELTSLETLNLSMTEISSLPKEIIQKLIHLKTLDIETSFITSLPDEISALTELETLSLKYTSPDSDCDDLPLSRNFIENVRPFDVFPNAILNLPNLKNLDLSNTQIGSLPEEISNLTTLRELNLNGTNLTSLPNNITNLPQGCVISLQASHLSSHIIEALNQECNAPDYEGPRFEFEMTEDLEDKEHSTNDMLDILYKISGKTAPPEPFPNITRNDTLNSWLNRLSYMADFKVVGARQKELVNNILQYLEKANSDEKFRNIFKGIIEGAAGTCGDRMSLSILHLGLNYKIEQAPLDFNTLKGLLKGLWGISLLECVAREKVKTLHFVDEIEVYLGYPIMLKDDLDLPIDVTEMLYFACSCINSNDLTDAKEFVLKHYNNNDVLADLLISHDKWKEALYLKNPELRDWRNDQLEKITDDEDHYTEIDQQFKGILKKKTLEILLN